MARIQLTDMQSEEHISCHTKDLSLFGCFVETKAPFLVRTKVRLRISHAGTNLVGQGNVANSLPNSAPIREYAFVEGYRVTTHSQQQIDGVVVVFLGQKGGVAAATLADIRRWHEGYLTGKLFLDRCSLDPVDSFHDGLRR